MSHFKVSHKDAVRVFPEGKYDASIFRVEETDAEGRPLFSKKGEAMQKVVFECYTNGNSFKISQYFTAQSMAYLYKRLAAALGQEDQFKRDEFNAMNYVGHNLILDIEIEEDKGDGEQNRIKAFEKKPAGSAAPTPVIPRQVTAPKPRPVDNVATAREMDPSEIPFSAGDYTFS